MADAQSDDESALAAGDFSPWMGQIQGALRGEGQSDVPCGGCTACCTSSQFIHIEPDETDTLAHIPADLLFAAPRLPEGHVLLGYDERGHCPMLVDNGCSIYEHRPRTCRTYDCRVLPAAGLEGDDDKPLIAHRARRWQFSFPTQAARTEYEAVGAAAIFLDQHRELLADLSVPPSATQVAVLAIEIHHLFLMYDETAEQHSVVEPNPQVVRAEVLRAMGANGTPPDGPPAAAGTTSRALRS
jgi:uncharacterized protein